MNSPHQNVSIDMLVSSTYGQISNNFEFGYFWHLLAIFRIENGFLVTLLLSNHLNLMIKVHDEWVDINKSKLLHCIGVQKGGFLDFEND